MCLIVFAESVHPRHRLVLAANRDELHARPTSRAAFWSREERIFGGRDLQAGGTWLGVTRDGTVAALTNVRSPDARRDGRSRGLVVRSVLEATSDPLAVAKELAVERERYPSFNLLVSTRTGTVALTDDGLESVAPGIHGLSNARLDTPWPKVRIGKERVAKAIEGSEVDRDALFAMLGDRTIAPDAELPSTGVPLALERVVSAAFIVSPVYGTRASTIVLVGNDGRVDFEERSYASSGELIGTVRETF